MLRNTTDFPLINLRITAASEITEKEQKHKTRRLFPPSFAGGGVIYYLVGNKGKGQQLPTHSSGGRFRSGHRAEA